jgi:hypothetical protein
MGMRFRAKGFDAEERHMKARRYPRLAEHAALHATFVAEFSRLEAVCAVGRPKASAVVEPSESLGRWLREHVRKADGEMGRYLRGAEAAERALAETPSPACLLDSQGVIRYVNAAWDDFARANGGAPDALGASVLGTRWLDHVAGEDVRAHHAGLLEAALRGEGTGAISTLGECNSAETIRLVVTKLERVVAPALAGAIGVAVSCRTLRSAAIQKMRPAVDGDGTGYRHPDGSVFQCTCCRRTRRPGPTQVWDFVPALVRRPPERVAFTFCQACADQYLRTA